MKRKDRTAAKKKESGVDETLNKKESLNRARCAPKRIPKKKSIATEQALITSEDLVERSSGISYAIPEISEQQMNVA